MACGGCRQKRARFEQLRQQKLGELKQVANKTPKQIRIEARNARMKARNEKKKI